nr:MAG TPA: hypothetical protein [Caudoviricetes sp.]
MRVYLCWSTPLWQTYLNHSLILFNCITLYLKSQYFITIILCENALIEYISCTV